MNIDFDNPKWTAYVLGELSPEERAAVELELAASEDIHAFVKELQLAASAVKEEVARQPVSALSFEQRKTVREAAGSAPVQAKGWLPRFPLWAAAGVAAAGLVVAVALWRSKPVEPVQMVDVRTPPPAPPAPPAVKGSSIASPDPVIAPPQPGLKPPAAVGAPGQERARKTVDDAPLRYSQNLPVSGSNAPAAPVELQESVNSRVAKAAQARAAVSPASPEPSPAPAPAASLVVVPPLVPAPVTLSAAATVARAIAPVPAASVQDRNDRAAQFGDLFGGQGQGDGQGQGQGQGRGAGAAAGGRGGAPGGGGPAGGAARGGGGGGGRGGGGNPAGGGAGGGQGNNNSNNLGNNQQARSQGQGQGGGVGNNGTNFANNGRSAGAAIGGTLGGVLGGVVGGVGGGTDPAALGGVNPFAGPVAPEPQQQVLVLSPVPLPLPPFAGRPIAVDVYGRLDNRSNNTEAYDDVIDNPFYTVGQDRATLAIDVDTASYSNVRRFLSAGQLPPRAAVRIEELVNYFSYDYPRGATDHPITANIEAAAAPWNPQHRLVRIGIKAKDVQVGEKPSNLVFLIDVSGSMEPAERLPLLKSGLRLLVQRLTENDRVTIVTYAGDSGIALPPTNGSRKDIILAAIDGLRAEGSTNGGAGIQTAYDMAAANFIRGGVNRVVLMTDGDFNVGITNQNDLTRLIEDKAKTGVFLSVLGVGSGNVKDSTMERLADRGNGIYAYLDSLNEARKVLVDQMAGTLIAVAKDVKVRVEFNPAQVAAYRLIGYENRALTSADFTNDKKDAGDMGAGHAVTALFEVVPVSAAANTAAAVGSLRYQPPAPPAPAPAARGNVAPAVAREMLNLEIRYQDPEGTASKLIEFPLIDRGQTFESASADFRFAAAVAEFGMLLRSSPYRGGSAWESVISIANASRGADREGYREEFVRLAQRAEQLWRLGAR